MKSRIAIALIVILAVGVIANGYFNYQQNRRLNEVQAILERQQQYLANLNDNISAVAGNIPGLNSGIAALAADASALKSDVSGLAKDTVILKGDTSTLKGDASTLKDNVSTLKGDTATISSNISTMSRNIDSLRQDTASNAKAFQGFINVGPDTVAKVSPLVVRVDVTGLGFEASGSGTIVSKSGYILTNEHVISGAISIAVTTIGGERLNAFLVQSDQGRDLALLKVNAGVDFPQVVFGSVSDIVVGEEVLAIGFALGPDFVGSATVTKGIVSAVRNFQGYRYIQTDVAINPGNSGGCLVTLGGKMIGVPTARIEGTLVQIELIGLVIPIDEVKLFTQPILGQ